MSRLLRVGLDELDVYVTRIADHTGIPASHIEKDYWVAEVLRGAAAASRMIQRFSEDIDPIAVLPQAERRRRTPHCDGGLEPSTSAV